MNTTLQHNTAKTMRQILLLGDFLTDQQINLINRAVMASIISDGLDLNGDKCVLMQALGPSYQKYI